MEHEQQSTCGGHPSAASPLENPIIPLFLLKTYSILDTANPEIVAWSNEGDSFTVKDIERFSDEVIPAHFKHNKFSSFVRQLNFYGFRKVKGKLTEAGTTTCSWEFRHPCFLRGHPDLLSEIKRSSSRGGHKEDGHGEVEGDTIESLRAQVARLTEVVEEMTRAAEEMQEVIAEYQRKEAGSAPTDDESVSADWDIADDDLLMTYLEDMKETPAPASSGGLKRCRSVEEFSAVLEMMPKRAKPSADLSDPAVIQQVASAIARSTQSSEDSMVTFEQYVSAVGSILSCAGMSNMPCPSSDAPAKPIQKIDVVHAVFPTSL